MSCGKEGVRSLVIIDVLDAPFKRPLAISKLFNVFISAIVAIMRSMCLMQLYFSAKPIPEEEQLQSKMFSLLISLLVSSVAF